MYKRQDSWEDVCGTDSLDETSTPVDLDGDGFCDSLDQDSDDDGVVDDIDAFPDDPAASVDTDGDGNPDSLVGVSTSDPQLIEDLDDDNDGVSDKDEIACGTDPLTNTSIPPEDLSCISVSTDSEFAFMTYWWCCVLLLLLLALLLPLVFLAGEKGQTVLMMLGLNKGPQPMYTTSVPEFVSGRGTQSEPFVLQPITGVKMGDSVESKETITITKLELGTEISITDLDSDENENRFNMDFIEVQEDEEEDEGFGSVVFRLQFNDNKACLLYTSPSPRD